MTRGLFIYCGESFRSFGSLPKLALRTIFFLLLWLLFQNNTFAQITANFSASVTEGCSPLVVCFTDLSTGGANNWMWNFGNGNLSPDHNPCAIYIVPGTYTVSLTASNGGDSDTKTMTALITVFANPVANFTPSKTLGCAPETITFTDNSTPGDAAIVSWRWDFGDGNTSTQQSPTNTYTNPGVYSVVLEVVDANGCKHRLTRNNLINILGTMTVDFSAAPNSACSYPATIQFTDQSSGSMINSWLWEFGDGTTSTDQNPTHTYNSAGSFDVKLTVNNAGGCTKSRTKNDFLDIEELHADFTVNDDDGCGSLNANFTNTSTSEATIVSYAWDFGDGGTSNVENTTHNYSTPGTYDVSLIVTTNNGCKDTIVYDDLIHVYPRPTVDFAADQTDGCSNPFVVNFTEHATDDASWLWEFGDGDTSTLRNPSHAYTAPGSYGVRLTVTSADGCTRTRFKADYITVTSPVADFSASALNGCIDLVVNFFDESVSSEPITGWLWSFGDGGTANVQNPSHTYTTIGEFDVRLIIRTQSGCYDTIVMPGYIAAGDTPSVIFGSDRQHVCLGTPINFYDSTDTGDEWHWDFGDGGTSTDSTPTYTYTDTGAFSVTLVVLSNGCADTLTIDDYVSISPPRPGIDPDFNCVNPYEVVINDNSLGPNEWLWDFGDGSPTSTQQNNTHTYAATGTYNIHLVVRDTMSGCIDSMDMAIRITDPVADFSGTNLTGCYPLIVNFTSSSVDADTYQWFFGDGDTSSQQDPIKVYDTTGVFDVTLIITDIHGCTDTIVRQDYVTVYGAEAWFEADTLYGCTPLHVDYTDLSTSFLGTVTSWNWNFGNGTSSAQQHPSMTYNEPGVYSITLHVEDSNGCIDSTVRVNYIIPTYPHPDFEADDTIVCVGQDVNFENLSIGTGMTFLWTFGDGATSTDSLPTHAYAAKGRYTVSLTATDVNGCDSTMTKSLYIRVVQPVAALTADSTFASCPPLWVHFTDLTPANDSIEEWLWDFGDNQTSDLQHPTHVYTASDTFLPMLTVTDFNGCVDTAVFQPVIVTGPVGNFDFIQNTYCVPVPVQFFSDAADTIIHIYDYGDGSIGVYVGGDTIVHNYTYPGIFHPSLVLDDGHGCVISIDHPDSIITFTVIAGFTSDMQYLCRGNLVSFYDTSLGVSNPVSWFWDFGDGDTSTLQNPTHYYGVPGSYDVMLVVTNSEGCTDTMIQPQYITVDPGPVADFTTVGTVCIPEIIQFTDASVSDSAIVAWFWDFGNGQTSTAQNPTTVYNTVDTFTVTLIIETVAGCFDTVSKPIITHGPPVADAGPGAAICAGDSAQLNGSGGITFAWSPAATVSDSTIANPVVFPTVTTTYYLTVTNADGCPDVDSVTITVHPLPVINTAGSAICVGDSAQLNAAGGVNYIWSPAATLSDASISNPFAKPVTTTTYTVTVTDVNGCVNTASTTLTVHPLPVPGVSAANSYLCAGQGVQLNATGGVSYSWSPATWLNNPNIANPYATPPVGGATYVVTVTDSNGCKNTDTITINVHPLPNYNITGDQIICIGDTTGMQVIGGDSYLWYPSTGLSCTTCATTEAFPDTTTLYYVDITNNLGCTVTDSILITVNPLPVTTVSADTAVCYTESYQLLATGGVSYAWTPAATLTCSNCPNPVATPDSTTTYIVAVTSAAGCVSHDTVTVLVRQLHAIAQISDTVACVPASVHFNDQSVADGTITSWHWTFGDGATSSLQHPQHDYLTPGTYPVTLTINSSWGCIDSITTPVVVNPLPVVDAGNDTTICTGDTAYLAASGGVMYQWSPAATLSDAAVANPMAFPVANTTYTVTVTDSNGCQNIDSVTVSVNPLPVVTISNSLTICATTPVQLNATGGETYSWTPATFLNDATIPNPRALPIQPITYTVLVTDSNGCSNTGTVNIHVNPLPVSTVAPDTAICVGASVPLWATGGVSYLWYPDSTLNCDTCANVIATPEETTTYQVNIVNAYNCVITRFVTVTVHPLPAVTVTSDTFICSGSSAQLIATGGANYAWSPATGLDDATVATPVASPDTTTTYIVTITSAFGCVSQDTVAVEVLHYDAAMQLSDTFGCLPVNVQFTDLSSATDSIVSWVWDFGNSRGSSLQHPFHPFGNPGVFNVQLTITTARGCKDSTDATVTVLDIPVADAGPDTAICRGESVTLQGSGGGRYDWSPNIGLSAMDIANPVATPNVTRYYELIVTDNTSGCMDRDSVLIVVNDMPVTTISAGTALCYGDSTQLEVTGGYSYIWTPAAGLSSDTIANPIATPDSTTVYVVEVSTEFGCKAIDSVAVVVRPLPNLSIKAAEAVCLGDSTQFDVSGATNYEWYPTTGLSCSNCADPIVKPDTSTVYYVRMIDAYNCVWLDTVPLTVNPLPTVSTIADVTLCKGEEIELTSEHEGATAFLWTPATGLSQSNILSPVAAPQVTTEYVIAVVNEFGCPDRDTVVVTVIDHVQASVNESLRMCMGQSVTLEARIDLSGISGAQVMWLPMDAFDDPTQLEQIVSPGASTNYTLVVFGGTCLPDTQFVHVHVDSLPTVDAGPDQVVMAGTEVTLSATSHYNITGYYWSPAAEVSCEDCQTTTHIADHSQEFYVSVVDANGCPAKDSVFIRVIESCEGDIWVPNAFTPNGDEANDIFRVRSSGMIELIHFRVFDRWGNQVFETEDFNEGWDGKYKGEMVNPNVYVWYVRASCPDGSIVNLKGNVTAIR